jgi:DNA-binding NarL/FixJ family response regulator
MSRGERNATRWQLLIADDHRLFRHGLRQLLETEGYCLGAAATSGDKALTAVAKQHCCVLPLERAVVPGMNVYLSRKTVLNHVSAICRKLDVRSPSEATVKGMEQHLIARGGD